MCLSASHRDRSYGSLAGRAAGSVYSHAADADKGFPCRCVNGCPAASDGCIVRPAYCPLTQLPAPACCVSSRCCVKATSLELLLCQDFEIRIWQPKWHTMFCGTGEKRIWQLEWQNMFCEGGGMRILATGMAYYVLQNRGK